MKLLYRILPLVITLVFAGSCSHDPKTYRIGVSQCSEDDWRMKMNDEIYREVMFTPGVTVEIRSADDSNEKQIADIRYFKENGFDIIIAAPNEADAITPVIKEVYDDGIPVIIFDRNIHGETYTAFQGVDNVAIGRAAAHYARHLAGNNARIIEIYGLAGSTPAIERHKGFLEGMEQNGGMTLVASACADWNLEDAAAVTDSLIKLYPDVDLIYAHNDRMAIGASQTARSKGLHPYVIGIDAAPEIGIRAVADSLIDVTFLYPTEGHRLIRTAMAILNGEPFDSVTYLPLASPVDNTNADILLLQNESLKEETTKMKLLKSQVDDYWSKHSAQTTLFYAAVVILILLFGVLFLLLRSFWQHKRHQAALMNQNRLLEEQRDMQARLNEQLNEATQSKLAFFTNVSHDLRTPLTLIAEPVEQLAEAGNLTPQQHTLIKIADKNVRILKRLINQILDFRKHENGKLDLNLTEIDFGKAVGEWMESFDAIARKRDMTLKTVFHTDGPVMIALDAEKIERVFFNLISNAFKYTPDNGTIIFSCSCDGKELTFTVADNGQGISDDDLGNIFERFYQVDKVHPKGSGIGLSLAKAFVELHGGSISAESQLGKGTTFTVTLPLRHIAPVASTPARAITGTDVTAELDRIENEASTENAEKHTLLVIDDNTDIQQLVTELMKDDYRVICAPDGQEGLRLAARYVPDLIICDVMMPVMDGLECCRKIKEEISTSHIPVLMLTACTMDEQRASGYESGADGYLSKPFSSKVLKARCHSLIENRKRIRQLWKTTDVTYAGSDSKSTPAPAASTDIDNDFYARFIEIFRKEMGNAEINVDALAAKMGLGRSQFYRKIKSLTNYSPVELIRQLRLKQARTLLTTTGKTISEIAYEVGFSTPAYFTKCYREAFGETPSELRDRIAPKG